MRIICLENNFISLKLFPDLGAKIASIFYKPQSFEVLFRTTEYKLPKYGDPFENYDTSGIDEMFPNVDKGKYPFEEYFGEILPDHGELWSIPWNCYKKNNNIHCEVISPKFNYIFKRTIHLEKNKIFLAYSVKNLSNNIFRGFWTFHGLIAIDENSEIILNVKKVINVHKSKFLGNVENICSYPEYNNYRLNKFLPKSSKNTEKFYLIDKVTSAGLTLNNNKLLYTIEFPEIPYLGIWKNEGGFKNQFNCALEPSNGFYDSLEIAKKYQKILTFQPFEEKKWDFRIILND
ncbi:MULTISPECIES: hypothetical protein [unclassified Marinitoga]|uniref:hypothetical protein n=1 Tax=unclassified Marinitoga TaxID=2640159 RepID=UPI0006417153|nr:MULTISPECIES: hypothetical protein [unclassified Marinitoga]KLO24673.1 hypothetical protein X274_02695 [Marinitoga sp. 1155]NUU98885.1 hypothetical protein [Marinitoga sp. 1154]